MSEAALLGFPPRTHCKHGHPFTPENTVDRADGRHECRECRRDISRRYKRRERILHNLNRDVRAETADRELRLRRRIDQLLLERDCLREKVQRRDRRIAKLQAARDRYKRGADNLRKSRDMWRERYSGLRWSRGAA